jgi:hypothetical protein
MTPLILRVVVEVLVVLFARRLVANPGLSTLIPSDAAGFKAYLRSLLSVVDLYYVWHVVLLLIGSIPLSGLSKGKAVSSALTSVIIMLLLLGIPGFLKAVFSKIPSTGGYYFF